MLGYIYNYFFPEKEEIKLDLLILKKSININDMNELDNNSYRIN
jgi:hypothetical protein